MIIELVRISPPVGKKEELLNGLASLVGPIQVERGCLGCRLLQTVREGDGLLMESRWDSEENLIRHLQSGTYKKMLLMMELSAVPPDLEFFTVLELRGLDLVETARAPSN